MTNQLMHSRRPLTKLESIVAALARKECAATPSIKSIVAASGCSWEIARQAGAWWTSYCEDVCQTTDGQFYLRVSP